MYFGNFAVVVLILLAFGNCQVHIQDVTVCYNQNAVLTCTTNTGVVRWRTPGGVSKQYSSPTNIGVIRDLDGLYSLNLTSVNSMTVFTSTATTVTPVTCDQSLTCLDALFGGNSQIAIIRVERISAPSNVQVKYINDTSVKISWSQTDVKRCVTGYYINIISTSQIVPIESNETSAIISVTPNTFYMYTVIATDGFMNRSSDEFHFDTCNVSPISNLSFMLNTSTCSEGILSWDPPNDIPNCVTGYYIEYNGMLQLYYTTKTSITVPVTNNTLNVYTVTATNGLMRNSTAESFSMNASGPNVGNISLDARRSYTGDTSLLILWNVTDIIPERFHVGMTRMQVYLKNMLIANISNISVMSYLTTVSKDTSLNVTLVAYNCFGSSTVTRSVQVPVIPHDDNNVTPSQLTGAIIGVVISSFACLIITIVMVVIAIAIATNKQLRYRLIMMIIK